MIQILSLMAFISGVCGLFDKLDYIKMFNYIKTFTMLETSFSITILRYSSITRDYSLVLFEILISTEQINILVRASI